MRRAGAASALLLCAAVGCAGVSGGRYRDTLQKLNREKPGSTAAPICESAVALVKCSVLFPEKDVSDAIGLARDVGALDPKRVPAGEDRVYWGMLVDNAPYVDIARHGADGLYPGVPFVFDISQFDADHPIEKARLTVHAVKENQVVGVTWWLARLRRGVVEGKLDDPAARKDGAPLALPDANLGKDPWKMFDGLKYLTYRSKVFDGRTYFDYLTEGGLLDAKVEEAQKEKDAYTFDVTAALVRAREEQLPAVLLFLAPKVQTTGQPNDPSYLFLATRAAPESLRPALAVEYHEPPPPDPEEEAKAKKKGKKK